MKNYIITGNKNCVKSLNYNDDCKVYNTYIEDEVNKHEMYTKFVIQNNGEITKLIDCWDGFVRIWNFHSNKLLNKIAICPNCRVLDICMWKNDYLLIGGTNNVIKLVDLENYKIVNDSLGYAKEPHCIKAIISPQYGEYLAFIYGYGNIKVWKNKKIKKSYLAIEFI